MMDERPRGAAPPSFPGISRPLGSVLGAWKLSEGGLTFFFLFLIIGFVVVVIVVSIIITIIFLF